MKTNVVLLLFKNYKEMEEFDNYEGPINGPFIMYKTDSKYYFYEEETEWLYSELLEEIKSEEVEDILIFAVYNGSVNRLVYLSNKVFKIDIGDNNVDAICIKNNSDEIETIEEKSSTTMTIVEGEDVGYISCIDKYNNALVLSVNFKTFKPLEGSREVIIDIRDDIFDIKDAYMVRDKVIEYMDKQTPVNIIVFVNKLTSGLGFKLMSLFEISDFILHVKNRSTVECIKCRHDGIEFNADTYINSLKENNEIDKEQSMETQTELIKKELAKNEKEEVEAMKEINQGIRLENLSVLVLVKGLDSANEELNDQLTNYAIKAASVISQSNIEIDQYINEIYPSFGYNLVQHAVDSIENDMNQSHIVVMNISDNNYDPATDKVFNVLTKDIDIVILADVINRSVNVRFDTISPNFKILENVKFQSIHGNITNKPCNNCQCVNINDIDCDNCEIELDDIYDVVIVLGEQSSLIYLDSELHEEISNCDLIDTLESLTDDESDEYLIDMETSTFNIVCKDRLMSQRVYDLRDELLGMFDC